MKTDVTIVTPSIPARAPMLQRAIRSALTQDHRPAALSIAMDVDGAGASATRNRALDAVGTEWAAFLDDDDELRHFHLARLLEVAGDTGADLVASWYTIMDSDGRERPEWDPLPEGHRYRQFDLADPHLFAVTFLVRTDAARHGRFGFDHPGAANTDHLGFVIDVVAAGAKVVTIPDQTWYWYHHQRNTGGLADKTLAIYGR